MIRLRNLTKRFGKISALDIDEFSLERGEVCGVLGRNGAGKTTLFRVLLQLTSPTSGEMSFEGREIDGSKRWRKSVGAYLDERFLIEFLSAEEYLEFVAKVYELQEEDFRGRLDRFRPFFQGEILERNALIRELSQGNRKKVGIAAALLPRPRVLILDEPFTGIDPGALLHLKSLIRSQDGEEPCTTLLSGHDLEHVIDVSDRVVVFERGRIALDLPVGSTTRERLEDHFSGGCGTGE